MPSAIDWSVQIVLPLEISSSNYKCPLQVAYTLAKHPGPDMN